MKNQPTPGSPQEHTLLTSCVRQHTAPAYLSPDCSTCYSNAISCSEQNCIEECACADWGQKNCNACMQQHCKVAFNQCAWGTAVSPPESPECGLTPRCQMGLKAKRQCMQIRANG